MKGIHYNLKPNEILFGDDINEELRSIHENFQEIESNIATPSIVISTLSLDLEINEDNTPIDGSTFTPPITTEPSFIKVYQSTEGGMMIQDVAIGYAANGDYFDIIIGEITEIMLNVTIKVL